MTQRKKRFHFRDGNERRDANERPAPRKPVAGGGLWLFGGHAVLAALDNPQRQRRRLVATAEAAQTLAGELAARRAVPEPVERAELDRLLPPGAVHQGIALQTEPLEPWSVEDVIRLAETRAEGNTVMVVLDQVTDPHNVGAVLRSAAAFGAAAVMVQDRHAPEESGTMAKAASGALERVPVVREVNLARALERLQQAGFWCAGLAADGATTLAGAKLSGRVVLVLGSEGGGMRRLVRERCDVVVRLPMTGAVESLNVSNAAAVALYELARA